MTLNVCRECWEEATGAGRDDLPDNFSLRVAKRDSSLKNSIYPSAWVCPMCRKEKKGHVAMRVPEGAMMVVGEL